MAARHLVLDWVISYLLSNRAPSEISYSSVEDTKIFGFWLYYSLDNEKYVLRRRVDKLEYEAIRVSDRAEDEVKPIVIGLVGENRHDSIGTLRAKLFYDGLEVSELSPVRAYIYGKSKINIFLKWYHNRKSNISAKRTEKAFKSFRDRFDLLETIMTIRNKQYEDRSAFPDSISKERIIEEIAGKTPYTPQAYYVYLKPILESFNEKGIILLNENGSIRVLPEAWPVLSEYYIQ